ncbi:hypothetical protein AJ87_37785 [Rhizobium yanglingense]|nr:hypothetical protein AJ87_37785 [Rhizobium yanglingense]
MHRAIGKGVADFRRQLLEDVLLRRIANLLHRIEPQAIEPEFTDPIERIFDEVAAYRLLSEIDRRTPRRIAIEAEELGRIPVQVVSIRAEMVIDNIEQHHEAVAMCCVDECLEIVRRSVC